MPSGIRFRPHHAFAVVFILALSLSAATANAASAVVKAALWDKADGTQGIDLSTKSVKIGKVTFVVTNKSMSQQEHEFLVVKTDLSPAELPFTEADARVDEEKLGMARKALEYQIEQESDVYFATARLWDDGIIDPRDTRTVLAISLSAACNQPVEGTMEWGVFRH